SAGPSTNDASSAAPSYEKAASTSLGCAAPSALVIGRQRTLASGPTCGIASPAATEAATVAGSPAPALTNATKVVSPAAATGGWTRRPGRCPTRPALRPAMGAPMACAAASDPAARPPIAYLPVADETSSRAPSWLIATG